jgi:hypothetical protein
MTRLELLKIVVGRARSHGFEFRRWYTGRMGLPWISAEAAITLLEAQRRYYALLFSHEFAICFWKAGEEITFAVPEKSFERVKPDGSIATVKRAGFMRRSSRKDAWRYHLREMALAEEPLRYIRKYLNVDEELEDDLAAGVALEPDEAKPGSRESKKVLKVKEPKAKPRLDAPLERKSREKPIARPLPTGLPAFLKRPYP